MNGVRGLLASAIAAALLVVAAVPSWAAVGARRATVDFVIDGDTIAITGDEHVRLIGIDTPETQYSPVGAECYGDEASRFMESLLEEGDRVRLVFDVERRDRYDRLLAYVYRSSDGLFVNAEMVRKGYAMALTVSPNVEHADLLRRLARQAREHERGLWGECE